MSYTLIYLFTALPALLSAPLAGVLTDRWNRRWMMILCNCGAAFCSLAIALLFFTSQLKLWHLYLATGLSSIFTSSLWLVYTAATTSLVSKQHFGRTSAMLQLGYAGAQIISPALAGILFVRIQLAGIILIDFATFLFAIVTLLVVLIPKPQTSVKSEAGRSSLWRELTDGWTYIFARPGLKGLLTYFSVISFVYAIGYVLLTPFVLSLTSTETLGVVLSVASGGALLGGLVMSVWGGPKRRVYGILGFGLLQGGMLFLAGMHSSVTLIAAAAFLLTFGIPITAGSNQAIWQSKVPPTMQGRAFSTQRMIGDLVRVVAYLVAGPLVDKVFEPFLAFGGPLATSVRWLIGTGPGRGIGLLFILIGILSMLATVGGLLYPRIRLVEDELPDVIPDEKPSIEARLETLDSNSAM
jgi:predicted MFS family arabinose efflux permease